MSVGEPRVFFPQHRINEWVVEGLVDISATQLTILAFKREYAIEEAVFVKAEVTSGICPHDMLGRVFTRAELSAKTAEVMEDSMILGDHAYDLVSGWVGRPTTDFVTHSENHPEAVDTGLASEEELLARALGRT
jgi:hypothetical protein